MTFRTRFIKTVEEMPRKKSLIIMLTLYALAFTGFCTGFVIASTQLSSITIGIMCLFLFPGSTIAVFVADWILMIRESL